jgi:hypothetical protein
LQREESAEATMESLLEPVESSGSRSQQICQIRLPSHQPKKVFVEV